jgi:polyisoprenoid-binding protein YceI
MKPFTLLALTLLTPAALAQHRTFVIAPDASEVKMTLNTNHEVVSGTFQMQSGSIDFDPATPELSGSVIVLAASGKTGNGTRDKRMYNEVLLVEKHTTISFEPKSYTGTLAPSGDSTLQVTGTFTLLGAPHEITVPMQVHLEADTAKAKAHFIVPYVQWGLKNPSFLIWKADKEVAINLSLNGHLSK